MLTFTETNSSINGIKSSHDYTDIALTLLPGGRYCEEWPFFTREATLPMPLKNLVMVEHFF